MAKVSQYKPGPVHTDFRYPSLTDTDDSFRLLQRSKGKSACREFVMDTYSLSAMTDKYIAVSYVWGDVTDLVRILVNGQPFWITRTADLALQQVVKHKLSPNIWLDAICINQADDEEKGHQVRRMGYIYANGRATAASTGMTVSLRILFSRIQQFDWEPTLGVEEIKARQNACKDIAALLGGLSYFKRMWILQELACANRIFFMSHNACEGEDDFIDLYRLCYTGKGHLEDESPFNRVAMIAEEISRPSNAVDRTVSLAEAIARYSGGACKDPRDQIYSLLGLVRKFKRGDRDGESSGMYLSLLKSEQIRAELRQCPSDS